MLRTLSSAAMLLALSVCTVGCQSPFYGSPYGHGPGMYAPPVQQYPPGQAYPQAVPQGAYIPANTGISSVVGVESGAPAWNPGTTTAPSPNENPGSNGSGNGGVPDYDDPSSNPDAFPFDQSSSYAPPIEMNDASELTANTTFTSEGTATQADAFNPIQQVSNTETATTDSTDEAFTGEFFEPVPVENVKPMADAEIAADPFSTQDPFGGEAFPAAEETTNLYAYDGEGFRWVQGVIKFNVQDGRWRVQYSTRPDAKDKFGGSLTLANDERLKSVKPGDFVLVEGTIDQTTTDTSGKPLYRIQKLARLEQDVK